MSPAVLVTFVVAFLLTGGLLAHCLFTLRQVQQVNSDLSAEVRDLREQVVMIKNGAMGLGKRLHTLQGRLETMARRQDDLENRDTGEVSISHASKLVELGVGADELVSTCGLSHAEVGLLSLMLGRQRRTA